jgi:hypothetical protein
MCDYSLESIASREAALSDRLVSTTFASTISRGFAAHDDINVAVCLRPGTELAFDTEPTFEHPVTLMQTAASSCLARFRQINIDVPHTHHDMLEFADGTMVPVARLMPGQFATILQMPSAPALQSHDEAQSSAKEVVPA